MRDCNARVRKCERYPPSGLRLPSDARDSRGRALRTIGALREKHQRKNEAVAQSMEEQLKLKKWLEGI